MDTEHDFERLRARITAVLGDAAHDNGAAEAVWTTDGIDGGAVLARSPLPGVDRDAWFLAAAWGAARIEVLHAYPLTLGAPEPGRFTPEKAATEVARALGWPRAPAPVLAFPARAPGGSP